MKVGVRLNDVVVIRCTQKLFGRLPASEYSEAVSTTRLGDWCGDLFHVRRTRVILFISERSRLPVILPARDFGNVVTHLVHALGQVLDGLPVQAYSIQKELDEMQVARFAPTNSRSLLGTMNDFRTQLDWLMHEHPAADFLDLSLMLVEVPVGPLAYRHPAAVAAELLKS